MVWLMLVLKIPIGLLLWLVWWAIRQVPDELDEGEGRDGGSKVPRAPHHPHSPFPRSPRGRGPHGDPTFASPPRTRTRVTRARTREH